MTAYESIRRLWASRPIGSVSDLERNLESFRVLFAYHSGKIENDEITYHDTREIFENGKVTAFTGSPRAVIEQQNQRLCYDFLKYRIAAKEPLTIDLIKETHRILVAGTYDETRYIANFERPGEFKKHDYMTGIHEVGSPPEQVERDLTELLSEMNEYRGEQVLKTAAYFHARFEYIHPFADGNGRVGRTLLNYYLLIRGEPPLIVYDEDKRGYYQALEAYDAEEQIGPLYDFLAGETEKTWKSLLERSK